MKFSTRYKHHTVEPMKFEQSRTKQSFRDECDINNILKKYQTTGILPDLIKTNPQYGDFSSVETYQESMNVVLHANEQFESLSSHIRDRFNNDPTKFLEFATNPQNGKEMVKLGLAQPIETPQQDMPKKTATKTKNSKNEKITPKTDPEEK